MDPSQVLKEIKIIEQYLTYLPDNPEVYLEWRRLVEAYSVSGVQVHDTNLVASMSIADISKLITINGRDFRRFIEVIVVEP